MEPLLLALDTATGAPGAAVLRGERVLGCAVETARAEVVRVVLPLVERALAEAATSLAEIEAFALSIGPGSFTSLRVGVATLKGLAFGSDRPIAAVSSLRALGLAAPEPARAVLAVLDARRGEVYAGAWASRSDLLADAALLPEGVYRPEELVSRLSGARPQCVGEVAALGAVGSALGADEAERKGGAGGAEPAEAGAVRVGRLGLLELRAGRAETAASLLPRYLRRAQAEVVRAAREQAEAGVAAARGATRRPQR